MFEIAVRQAILHALVAAGIVEATLRAWRIRRACSRLRFWLLALAFPFLVLPFFMLAAPFRSADRFAAGWALFSSDRWNDVRAAGVSVDTMAFGLLMAAGTLLFLRDAVPFLRAAVRERGQTAVTHSTAPPAVLAAVADLARRSGCASPTIVVLQTDAPILFVRGLLGHTLVLSDGALARLPPGHLQAAIAHEVAHARFRDPLAGWMLMGARLLMFWNPAVQLVARAIVQEMEHRADSVAAQVTSAEAVAAALETLAPLSNRPAPKRGTYGRRFRPSLRLRSGQAGRDVSAAIAPLFERLHEAHIASRVDTVLTPLPELSYARTRLAVVGATLAVLLFFVV